MLTVIIAQGLDECTLFSTPKLVVVLRGVFFLTCLLIKAKLLGGLLIKLYLRALLAVGGVVARRMDGQSWHKGCRF